MLSSGLFCSCKNNDSNNNDSPPEPDGPTYEKSVVFDNDSCNFSSVGVWWWNDELDANKYLEFAESNSINEIYYCSSKFNSETSSFISNANERGIKVFWLDGNHTWLEDESPLITKINNYLSYQQNYPNSKFAGVHLDIEPHQSENFETDRSSLILKLIELASNLKSTYPEISFDYDIPFWLDDEILYNNTNLEAYKHMISLANRVFIMSYRDTATDIFDVSKEEIEYADSIGKSLVLGVETYSTEGDRVSFAEESKNKMYEELSTLSSLVSKNTGITIHHIRTWYDLKDE